MQYIKKLHQRIEAAGIPIDGVSSDRTVQFRSEATQSQRTQALAFANGHDTLEMVITGNVVTSPDAAAFDYAVYDAKLNLLAEGTASDGSVNLIADPGTYILEIQ